MTKTAIQKMEPQVVLQQESKMEVSNCMFGDGIYFCDQDTKSLNYLNIENEPQDKNTRNTNE